MDATSQFDATSQIDAAPVDDAAQQAAPLPALLTEGRMVVTMPDRPLGSLMAAVEVMVQEQIRAFSFPVGQLQQVSRLAGAFGPRATFGVHDIATAQQLRAALDAGAAFLQLRATDADLVAAALETGVPVLVQALTPTEVVAAFTPGVAAVVVVPAEVMGSSYPQALAELVAGVPLMARGGLGAYAARRWVEAGALAVWLDDALLGDVVSGGSLGGLRERCQTFRAAVAD